MGYSDHSWKYLRNRIISNEEYHLILKDIKDVPGFVATDGVEEIHEKHNIHKNIVKSIRSNYLRDKIRTNISKVSKKTDEIYGKYKLGDSIDELSREYHFPAVEILRLFLKKQGFDKDAIKELWKETPDSGEIWSRIANNKLRADWQECLYNDEVCSKKAAGNMESAASIVEGKICAKVDKLGIPYKTDKQLKKEMAKQTPDILFTNERPNVGSVEFNWIEIKSFFGSPSSPFTGVLEQVQRYHKAFGTGLLVHKVGIVHPLIWRYRELCAVMTGEQFDHFIDNYKT